MKTIDYKKFESLVSSAITGYKANIKKESESKNPSENLIHNLEGFIDGLNFIKQEVDRYATINEDKFLNYEEYKKTIE